MKKTSVGYIYWHSGYECLTWTGRGADKNALPMKYSVYQTHRGKCDTAPKARELVAAMTDCYAKVTFIGAYESESAVSQYLNTLPDWEAAK